jgi:cysteine synthase A
VAVRLAKEDEFAGKTIVTILPDSGERYLSTVLFEGIG